MIETTLPGMPVDTPTQILTQLWMLLNVNDRWEIDPVNQIRFDTVVGTQDPNRSITDDGDYPQARLWLTSGRNTMYMADESFATNAPEGPSNWIEQQQYNFKLEIISQLSSANEIDSLYLEAIDQLRKGGPKLGLDYVRKWVLSWRNDPYAVDSPHDNTVRWKAVIEIMIDAEINGALL